MGTKILARPGHRCCHICRETRPCSRLTPLTWADSRMARAVVFGIRVPRFPAFHLDVGTLPGESELAPVVAEVPIHQMKRENIVSGRNGSVRGENGALSNQIACFGMAVAGGDEFPDAFKGQEGRMALIAMPDRGINARARKIRTPPIPSKNS